MLVQNTRREMTGSNFILIEMHSYICVMDEWNFSLNWNNDCICWTKKAKQENKKNGDQSHDTINVYLKPWDFVVLVSVMLMLSVSDVYMYIVCSGESCSEYIP